LSKAFCQAQNPNVPKAGKASVSWQAVGQFIRELRLERGLTQAQLAKLLDTSPSRISDVERGKRALSVEQLVRLARSLGATTSEILGDDVAPAPSRRLRRFLVQAEHLAPRDLSSLVKMIDAFLRAHRKSRRG
jgi:transcriptional regulator with XRE-family HTH domain